MPLMKVIKYHLSLTAEPNCLNAAHHADQLREEQEGREMTTEKKCLHALYNTGAMGQSAADLHQDRNMLSHVCWGPEDIAPSDR